MPASATLWPLRQALSPALRGVILQYAIPAINAAITAQFPGSTPDGILQFSDDALILGELPSVSTATLEMDIVDQRCAGIASGEYRVDFSTQITLKIAQGVGNNSPEQIKFLGDCVCDNLLDALTAGANYGIIPTRPDGTMPLPPGSSFQDCRVTRILKPPYQVSAEGVLRIPTWFLYHACYTTLFLNRPGAL